MPSTISRSLIWDWFNICRLAVKWSQTSRQHEQFSILTQWILIWLYIGDREMKAPRDLEISCTGKVTLEWVVRYLNVVIFVYIWGASVCMETGSFEVVQAFGDINPIITVWILSQLRIDPNLEFPTIANTSQVFFSEFLGYRPMVCPTEHNITPHVASLLWISEPIWQILPQELNNVQTVWIAEWDWQLCSDSQNDSCPGLSSAPEHWVVACIGCGIATR